MVGRFRRVVLVVAGAVGLAGVFGGVGCAKTAKELRSPGDRDGNVLLYAVSADRQWTGVATVARGSHGEGFGPVIVNYPNWSDAYENAVEKVGFRSATVLTRGKTVREAFPSGEFNLWAFRDDLPELPLPVERQFVAVQSVHTDRAGRLWILDTGNPRFGGVIEGAAKLMRYDFGTGQIVRTYRFPREIASGATYLNDVRIDLGRNRAYITDSGKGGLVVVDLASGAMRRVLDGHPSTLAEPGFTPVIGGRAWTTAEGDTPQIHADGIAVSPDERWVYWQALTGRTLYRLPAALLADFSVSDEQLAAAVEDMGRTVVTDGMAFDDGGNLYFAALEHDAVMYRTPGGEIRTLWQSELLSWPDSFAYDAAGNRLFVTTAAIHRGPLFGGGDGEWPPAEGFRIYMIELE